MDAGVESTRDAAEQEPLTRQPSAEGLLSAPRDLEAWVPESAFIEAGLPEGLHFDRARGVPLRRRLFRQGSTVAVFAGVATTCALGVAAAAGLFRASKTAPLPAVQVLSDAWPEGTRCLQGCGKAGWCNWCGQGMACCQKDAWDKPLECKDHGGYGQLTCTNVLAHEGEQCGGGGWKGALHCVPSLDCVDVNPGFKQCRKHMQLKPALAFDPCSWTADDGKEWEALCPRGTRCRSAHGFAKKLCLPGGLMNPGQYCLDKCSNVGGSCDDFCGQGNACCQANSAVDPFECSQAHGFLTSNYECVVPAPPAAQANGTDLGMGPPAADMSMGQPAPHKVETVAPDGVLHWGQECLGRCHVSGDCDWCGKGNACCRKGDSSDPPECSGVTIFGAVDKHVCVKPVVPTFVNHHGQNCLSMCGGKAGYCNWCGKGNACCIQHGQNQPTECQGVTTFPTSQVYTCVQAVPGTAGVCLPGEVSDPHGGCVRPKNPEAFTFYMYHAIGNNDTQLIAENVNMASIAGIMWYLHNEVLVSCPRKYGITRIRRFRVTVKPTESLYFATQREFAPFVAYDYGKCTAPSCAENYAKYGYTVGCRLQNTVGTSYSPNPTWYSLPGACFSREWAHKTDSCKQAAPGGMCPTEEVSGTDTCTYFAEPAGEVDISELSGIVDYHDFCSRGFREFVPEWDKGSGSSFWDQKKDPTKCSWRIHQLQKLYHVKYPNMPITFGDPLCDSVSGN